MNVFDKFLGLTWPDDVTETPWWAEAVFRGLEERLADEQVIDSEAAGTDQSRI